MRVSRLLWMAGMAGLSGCAVAPRDSYPTAALCIHDQFITHMNLNHSPLANSAGNGPGVFAQAIMTCGETIPDLTGDTMMQGLAIMYNVQFRIDFAKDAKMKNSLDGQIMTTGSLIPLPALIFHKT